jgi:hypothetical protein
MAIRNTMAILAVLILGLQLGSLPGVLQAATSVAVEISQAQGAPPSAEQNTAPSSNSAQGATPSAHSSDTPSNSTTKSTQTTAMPKKRRRPKQPRDSSKVVVRNGSTPDPSVQFSTTASPEQAAHERQDTAGLLTTTDTNLQKLSGHVLNSSQQDMLTQIRSYMQQAKSAQNAGDLQGAHSLALKAKLLSAELLRK